MNICSRCKHYVRVEKTFCGITVEEIHLCRKTYQDPVSGEPLNYLCKIRNAAGNCPDYQLGRLKDGS